MYNLTNRNHNRVYIQMTYRTLKICFSSRHAQNWWDVVTNPQQTNAAHLGRDSNKLLSILIHTTFAFHFWDICETKRKKVEIKEHCVWILPFQSSLGSTHWRQQQQQRSLSTSTPKASLRKRADEYGGYFSSPIRDRLFLLPSRTTIHALYRTSFFACRIWVVKI